MSIPIAPFGQTGLRVTRMGLGLAALGRPGYINLGHGEDLAHDYVVEAMERRTHRLLDLAFREGIRYFDAARSYGRAEQFLHHWLTEKQPDSQQLHVGSKWGYTYTAAWKVVAPVHEVKEHSPEVLRQQWAESKMLQPHLKLYQIHSATFSSGVLDNREVLDELARLKKEEDVLIGLTLSGQEQNEVLERALAVERGGQRLFDAVQATFNILEPSSAPVLARAAELGMGVIVKEALANGRLTIRNNRPEFTERRAVLEQIAGRYEAGIDAVALAFALKQPWAHIVLSGAATERHLLANLSAFRVALTPGEMTALSELAMDKDTYWEVRSRLDWN